MQEADHERSGETSLKSTLEREIVDCAE